MSQAFRLGLFVVAALAVLFVGVFLIGNRQTLFQKTYRVKAEFQNVAGLADGADVRVGGLHEGTVKYIRLPNQPDGKITVAMDLDKGTRDVVKKDSMAAIKSEGLIGDRYIEISFGSEDAPKLKNGDTIQSEPPLDMSNLVKKADQLLDTAQGAVADSERNGEQPEGDQRQDQRGQGNGGRADQRQDHLPEGQRRRDRAGRRHGSVEA